MEYELKRTLFDDNCSLQQLVDLQNIVYAGKHTFGVAGFKHWYVDNPMGKVLSFNAFLNGEMVAHYACIPVKMLIKGNIVKGVLSMATVTHPNYRGRGLFKRLAKMTYDYARDNGYEFVIGVANANSFPGFMKYFPFTFVGQLDVKWGWGQILIKDKIFNGYWNEESLQWRLSKPKYYKNGINTYGRYKNYPFFKTLMGTFDEQLLNETNIPCKKELLRPLNLYVGLGADLSKGHYFNFPKFVKHSPFNLIFLDLTDGKLPKVTKDNIVFQLLDFDIA